MNVQRKWMYLEGIFIGGDIRLQLPDEAKMFDQVDKNFHRINGEAVKDPNIKASCMAPNRLNDLETMLQVRGFFFLVRVPCIFAQ